MADRVRRGAMRLVAASAMLAGTACSEPISVSPESLLSPDTLMSADQTGLRATRASLVSQVTGVGASVPTAIPWNVHATDLGHMFWHREVLYMAFGDTFGEGGLEHGRDWRSNVLARLAPPDPPQGALRIESMIAGPDGTAREVLRSRKVDGEEVTVIPTSGISTGDRMFLHYMSVRTWHDPGHWDVGHSGLAYSDDDGETWSTPDDAVWPAELGFEQVAFVRSGGFVYSLGVPGGRFGDVRLRRVRELRMLERDAHEYWDGRIWTSRSEAAAVLVPAPVGELSVAWNERHRQWMMMYLDMSLHAVVMRLAPELTGPWGPAQTVVSGGDHPGLYAPYIVPLHEVGDDVWFTMSKWRPYNVFLMRTTLSDEDLGPG